MLVRKKQSPRARPRALACSRKRAQSAFLCARGDLSIICARFFSPRLPLPRRHHIFCSCGGALPFGLLQGATASLLRSARPPGWTLFLRGQRKAAGRAPSANWMRGRERPRAAKRDRKCERVSIPLPRQSKQRWLPFSLRDLQEVANSAEK